MQTQGIVVPSPKKTKNNNAPPFPPLPPTLEMLLPELEPHIPRTHQPRRIPDFPRRRIRPTEIHADPRRQTPIQPANILPIQNPIPHGAKQSLEIRPSEIRPRLQFSQGVDGSADAVELDIRYRIDIEPLREIRMYAQELRRLGTLSVGEGLRFET